MNNEFQQHKLSDRVKWILTLVAFILIGVILTGIICGWFERPKEQSPEVTEEIAVTLPEQQNTGIRLAKTTIESAQYAAYDISSQAESAYTITATVTDDLGNTPDSIQQVSYSLAWETSNSANVNDYVTMTTSGTTAAFECLQPFGTRIIVICTSDLDPTKSATATLGYYKRIQSTRASLVGGNTAPIQNGDVITVSEGFDYGLWDEEYWDFMSENTSDYTFGTGTQDSKVLGIEYTISLSEDFKTALTTKNPNETFTFSPVTATVGYQTSDGGALTTLFNKLITSSYGSLNSWFYYFYQALSETNNQLILEGTITLDTVGEVEFSYIINFDEATRSIGDITVDKSVINF